MQDENMENYQLNPFEKRVFDKLLDGNGDVIKILRNQYLASYKFTKKVQVPDFL